jgi:ferrous iron transport protein B
MDKIMHKVGLHGQSFIPLLMGFGCNVPAIMATRTIKNKNNRILTILINPFMSCSARLPVYVLIISAFFTEHSGTILFSIYLFGIVMAGLIAILFKKTLFKTDEIPFVMELPPYRQPTLQNTLKHMWNKGSQYLKKMGGIILVASIIIWALSYYPQNTHNTSPNVNRPQQSGQLYSPEQNDTGTNTQRPGTLVKNEQNQQEKDADIQSEVSRQKNSYIGQIGRFISPVMRPLGFDWKMSVSLISGIAAKEIVVSTMGVLYQADTEAQKREKLIERLKQARYENGPDKGELVFDKVTALAFLAFILLYFPCVAALAAITREAGSWKWSAFAMIYTTTLAWLVAFLIQQIGSYIV